MTFWLPVEELRNLSQAKSPSRHPSMVPEKPEMFLRTTAADYMETEATLATVTETSTQISKYKGTKWTEPITIPK